MNSNSTINYKSTAPLQLSTSNIIKAYTTIWFRSHDIIKTITNLRARGQEFLNIPDSYYDMLRKRLAHSKVKVGQNIVVGETKFYISSILTWRDYIWRHKMD